MTLHGDRPTETQSGSQSPVNDASATGSGVKRAALPKADSVESIKRAKTGSNSPARRTVIEVLNTPPVESPLPKLDSANGTDGYFKDAVKSSTGTDSADAAPAKSDAKPEQEQPVAKEATPAKDDVVMESTAHAAEPAKSQSRPNTPPIEPAPPAAPTNGEDVTMGEPEPEATTESAPAAVAAAAAPSSDADAARPPTPPIEPSTSQADAPKADTSAPTVAQTESVDTSAVDAPQPAVAAAATATETGAEAEKKD